MKKFIKTGRLRRFTLALALLLPLLSHSQPNISRIEYFLDNDPGFGNGTAVAFSTSKDIQNLVIPIDPTTLSEGVHRVFVRAKDANGVWSFTNGWTFYKPYGPGTIPPDPGAVPNLTKLEYFIDTDPGFGNGTEVTFSSTKDIQNLVIPIDPTTLSEGVHRVFVRAKDANGVWSFTNGWTFYKPYGPGTIPPDPGAVPNLTKLEYFIDTDPGFGNGTEVTFSSTKDIQNLVIPIDPSTLSEGVHRVFVRAKDANGVWSFTNGWTFYKPYRPGTIPPAPGAVPKLEKLEYYIDTDPGYGLGIPVALDTLTDFNNYVVPINVTGLATGGHQFFVRGLDKNGSWSLVNSWTFNIPATLASPTIVVNSMTQTTRCARDSFDISYDATGTYNAGNVFNVEMSDENGSFSTPTVVGSYTGTGNSIIKVKLPSHATEGTGYKIRVSSTNPVVTGIATAQNISIHERPFAQTITGAGDVNASYSYPYSVPVVSGSTWKWIAGAATITLTNNTADLLWNTPGQPQQVRVVETNQYGCPGDTSIKPVNVYQLKIDNVNVSSLTPCPEGNITVTASATGVYDGPNIFTAQLSDAAGSFASPVNIGTVAANPVGLSQAVNISATLPKPMANGTGYRVRVISSSPSVTGSDNGQNITVDKPELGANKSVTISCVNGTADITTLYNTSGYTNVTYSDPTPAAVAAGDYTLIVTNSNGCKDTATITVMPARIETVVSTGGISEGSNRECTDADGWTNYYNTHGTPDDYSDDDMIMSIKKNGNDIGTVGMSGGDQFMVNLVSITGAGSGQGIDVQSPLVGSGNHYFSMYRYWDITAAKQPVTPVNIRFYFHTDDLNDVNGSLGTPATPDQLTAYHLPDGNADPSSNWAGATSVDFYQHGATPSLTNWVYTDLGNGMGQAEFMVSSFSGGGLGFYQMGPVPVSFISFNAVSDHKNVLLSWSTGSETNSDRFEIQRSLDGTRFETIGTVAAAGNSNTIKNYSYVDVSVSSLAGRKVYYRILQVDKDGNQLLSDVRHVNLSSNGNALTLLYNPVKDEAVLHYMSAEITNAVVRVVDQLGRVQLIRQVSVIKGLNEIKLPTRNIAQGIYMAELISNKDRSAVSFLKE